MWGLWYTNRKIKWNAAITLKKEMSKEHFYVEHNFDYDLYFDSCSVKLKDCPVFVRGIFHWTRIILSLGSSYYKLCCIVNLLSALDPPYFLKVVEGWPEFANRWKLWLFWSWGSKHTFANTTKTNKIGHASLFYFFLFEKKWFLVVCPPGRGSKADQSVGWDECYWLWAL